MKEKERMEGRKKGRKTERKEDRERRRRNEMKRNTHTSVLHKHWLVHILVSFLHTWIDYDLHSIGTDWFDL